MTDWPKQDKCAILANRIRSLASQIPGTEDCYEAADMIEAQSHRIAELEDKNKKMRSIHDEMLLAANHMRAALNTKGDHNA